ncbi:hypothetical protein SEA_MAGRITTE_48 [Microbacterium phage Magritte]|nr:hypothetical protein SEA_MAGRITTE_48 [Microbacterium phage Magritte]
MTPEKNHDLTLEEVVPRLRSNLEDMRTAEEREELNDISPDTAFELGYETAIHDLVRYTGPDPVEAGIITYKNTGETHDDAD